MPDNYESGSKAIETENKAIHADWANHPLQRETQNVDAAKDEKKSELSDKVDEGSANDIAWFSVVKVENSDWPTRDSRPSIKLLEEVVIFMLLEELSLHLSSHFNDSDNDARLVELKRSDIPEFLLENRVLNLLSTPIEQREIFLKAFPEADKRPDGEICSLFGSNGAMYQRFDLVLPRGSKLKQLSNNGFSITTDRFRLDIEVAYGGFSKNVPPGFSELYLNQDRREVDAKNVNIKISGQIFLRSLFNARGWEYHNWLDSFRSRIISDYDIEAFFVKINWSIVAPIFRVGIPLIRKFQQKKAIGQARKPH